MHSADQGFWEALESLAARSEIVIDQPRGSAHPRYPGFVYEPDYGYLKNTSSMAGAGSTFGSGRIPDGKSTP